MKNSKATIQKRRDGILKLLYKNGKMQVESLSAHFGVTTATIRRDLVSLEGSGLIRRGFGTAEYVLSEHMREIEPTHLEDEKELTRRRIAKKAADLIDDGDVIFMNSSGTASLILEYLGSKHVTVLTNNARVIQRPHNPAVNIILVGGELYGKKQSLIGQFALDAISRVVATKCVLGVSGISAAGGLTSVILPETQINLLMIQQCRGPVIVVADGSKIGLTQSAYSGNLKDVTYLVTDDSADPVGLQGILQANVTILKA